MKQKIENKEKSEQEETFCNLFKKKIQASKTVKLKALKNNKIIKK